MSNYADVFAEGIKRAQTHCSMELARILYQCVEGLYSEDKKLAGECNKQLRKAVKRLSAKSGEAYTMLGNLYRLNARYCLDDYIIALEWKREPEKKFYLPRRRVLKPLVDDLQALFNGEIKFLGISLPPRVGKLVSDDTAVLTSDGWKNHGDLIIGDRVISPNGQFVKVTHVFPKAYANVRVYFSDGTFVDVHENHEWFVYNRHKQRYDVLETKEMMADYESGEPGKRGHRYHYIIPQKGYVRGECKHLPVPAYTLGAWLGDGRNNNPDICGDKQDRAIVERIIADGYPVAWHTTHKITGVEYYGFSGLRKDLQELGMCHSRRRVEKHIPDLYLTAPIQHRLALLAGLIDTDGCLIRGENRYQFTTSEQGLRDDFISLVSTFGWRCSVTKQEPHLSSSGIMGKHSYWVIAFNPDCYIPCQVERKQLRTFSKQRRLSISKIEYIDPKQGNCISVEGGLYCVGKRLIPTHNSTLCIMFMTWVMGNRPDIASVMSGHSDKLTDGFFREILSIMTDNETYAWSEIFDDVKIVDKSAKNETIDLNQIKRFPTITCRSIGGTLTGAVEIGNGGILYCDDLIEDLEESLNPIRLQAKYDAYLNQLKDRKKLGALELMVGTRWNVFDPLGMIQQQYADDPDYRFRVIPALDENDHSNFVYDFDLGFDDAYYHDMRESIDAATWWAKYMGSPYIREGLLFPEPDLRYYNGVLPDGEPDRIMAACDTAWGGGDSLSMPFAYVYGDSAYIHDVVFNRGDKTVTRPIVIAKMKTHKPHQTQFEQNNGGDEYADIVDSQLRAENIRLNITSRRAPTTQSKLSRIIMYAPEIRKFYFRDANHRDSEYRAFMNEVTMFTQSGKNVHDDAPDSLAMLADMMYGGSVARVTFAKRLF